jgi:PAS domain S-box-containing protein
MPYAYPACLLLLVVAASVALLALRLSRALARSEAERCRQAALLDASHDAILVWRLGGWIVYWNRGAEALYGWSAIEAVGRVSHELLRTEHGASMREVERALAEEGRWEGELVHTTRDGRRIVVESRHVAVPDGRGQVYVLEVNRDISERRRSEVDREALLASERTARSEAERAVRLREEFVATVSHELRTPLNAIIGWTSMLQNGKLDAAGTARALEVVARNARVQAQLVEDLLDLSRISAGKLRFDVRAVDLSTVVDNVLAAVSPAAEAKGVRLDRGLDPLHESLLGDAGRIEQILVNLLSNAVKFTPRGGRVQVQARRARSRVEITVRDTGQGIAPELLPHVFERFRQGDASITRAQGSLGLGLSLVKHLVELHGGDVRAESEGEGRGSTFTVSLPVAAARELGEGPSPIEACESLCGVKVLVVDDEQDARDLVKRVLEDCAAEVVTAGSAAEAIEVLPRFLPNVLVSDIGMPELDGYHMIRAVRSLDPDQGGRTPAIALTAFARPEDRLRALRAGYQMHLAKPVDQSELVVVVANLAGRLSA